MAGLNSNADGLLKPGLISRKRASAVYVSVTAPFRVFRNPPARSKGTLIFLRIISGQGFRTQRKSMSVRLVFRLRTLHLTTACTSFARFDPPPTPGSNLLRLALPLSIVSPFSTSRDGVHSVLSKENKVEWRARGRSTFCRDGPTFT